MIYLLSETHKYGGKRKMLNITDIRVKPNRKKESKLKALVSLVIDDCFAVHGIKIIAGADGEFIAMPTESFSDGVFRDIVHPLNSETREVMKQRILEVYRRVISEE